MNTDPPWLPESDDVQRLLVAGYKCVHGRNGFFARRADRLVVSGALRLMIVQRLLIEQRNRCVYCEDPITDSNATLEHKQPLSRGGTWKRYNLAAACAFCNKAKADLTQQEFVQIYSRYTFNGNLCRSHIRNAAKNVQRERAKLKHQARQSALPEHPILATTSLHMAVDCPADTPVAMAH